MNIDEEMANKYVTDTGNNDCTIEAFLAGLKAGRPKWHKVADGDLPEEEAEYLVIFESDGTRYRGLESYYPDEKVWSTICNIIAWCEIPKYTEE